MPQHPNVLFIHSDQHRFDCLGANGHPVLRTPNLDRLARSGVNFTHAFCPIPLCTPTRSSLLFGQWPTGHLAIANSNTEAPRPAQPDLPTYSQCLRDSGDFLAYVGKWHVHPQKTPLEFGFEQYISESAYTTWRLNAGLKPLARLNGWFGEVDPHIRPEQSRLAWGADQIIDLLVECATSGKPFHLRWDPSEPHLPNIVPEPFCSMYPPAEIPPWPGFADKLVDKPFIQAQQQRTWKVAGWTWAQWAPIVGRYLGEISLLDAQIGRILDVLAQTGLARNTVVIYTSDHGDLCGSHGMFDKHFIMYDDVVRVPLIIAWQGHFAADCTCDAFVSHSIDLASTFCDLAGVLPPSTFRGQSLRALLEGRPTETRPDIFSMYHGNQFGLYSQRMLRDRRWKYVWNATAEDELYDLESDPGELMNLAGVAAHRPDVMRLRQRLVAWMEDVNDPLLNQWTRPQLLEGLK